jgi:hypothetical protein
MFFSREIVTCSQGLTEAIPQPNGLGDGRATGHETPGNKSPYEAQMARGGIPMQNGLMNAVGIEVLEVLAVNRLDMPDQPVL